MNEGQLVDIIFALRDKHNNMQETLDEILNHKDADIRLGDDMEIKKGTDRHKGFLTAMILAKSWLGEFPVEISKISDEEE